MPDDEDGRFEDYMDSMVDAEADSADDRAESIAEAEARAERDDYYTERFREESLENAEAEFVAEQVRKIPIEKAQEYLGVFGDSIYERVASHLSEGDTLLAAGHFGPALILSAASIEIALGFLILRPMMHGAILLDEWAEILTSRILQMRSSQHRKLLPTMLRAWGIDAEGLRLSNGERLWPSALKELFDRRDAFVHEGLPLGEDIARRGLESARLVIDGLIKPLAHHLGMDWPASPWHRAATGITYSCEPFPKVTRI